MSNENKFPLKNPIPPKFKAADRLRLSLDHGRGGLSEHAGGHVLGAAVRRAAGGARAVWLRPW